MCLRIRMNVWICGWAHVGAGLYRDGSICVDVRVGIYACGSYSMGLCMVMGYLYILHPQVVRMGYSLYI